MPERLPDLVITAEELDPEHEAMLADSVASPCSSSSTASAPPSGGARLDGDIAPGTADHGSSPDRSPCHRRRGLSRLGVESQFWKSGR